MLLFYMLFGVQETVSNCQGSGPVLLIELWCQSPLDLKGRSTQRERERER